MQSRERLPGGLALNFIYTNRLDRILKVTLPLMLVISSLFNGVR
jgi:hypothetical protein